MTATTCQQIKARLSLRDAARLVNITLPERDGIKFCSPLRPDKTPSCTIKGDVFTDWSTNQHFDAIDFYAAAKGMSTPEAIRELAGRLQIAPEDATIAPPGKVLVGRSPHPAKPSLPAATAPSPATVVLAQNDLLDVPGEPEDNDFEQLRASRLLPEGTGGLELACMTGILRFGRVCGHLCWVVTDASNRAAEARRLDGQPFPAAGALGERKAHTLRGSKKDWPVGLMPRLSADRLAHLRRAPVVLVEGGPDLLAAYCILASLPMVSGAPADPHPVAMLGTAANLGEEALSLMTGRSVVILAHGDRAGREAANRWQDQLLAAKCPTRLRLLPDGRDLNDLVVGRTDLTALHRYLRP